jgi:histidinol-phosphate aminotransferase
MNDTNAFSRRGFMKGALLGGVGAMTYSAQDVAAALLAGKEPGDVRGWGIEPGVVSISGNENPLGPSPRAIEAVAKNLFAVNRYGSQKTPDLVAAIGRYHNIDLPEGDTSTWEGRRKLAEMTPIMVTSGSSPLLHIMATEAMKEGAEMILARPGYTDPAMTWMNYRKAKGLDLKIRGVRLDENYAHNLDLIHETINSNTTMVTITNPHNPTGTMVDHDRLVDFVNSVPSNVLLLLDEAYIHFARDPNYSDAVHLGVEKENVVVARTFSKGYGLAGMRVGYGIMHPSLVRRLKVHLPSFDPLGYLGVVAAEAAINDHQHIERSRKAVKDGEAYLTKELNALGMKPVPSHSNFMWVNLNRDAAEISNALSKHNVFVSNGKQRWDMDNFIRVTVGTKEENEAFIWAMQRVLSSNL